MSLQRYYVSYAPEDRKLKSKIFVVGNTSFGGVRIPYDLPLTEKYVLPKAEDFTVTESNGLIKVAPKNGFAASASISYGKDFLGTVIADFIDCHPDTDVLVPRNLEGAVIVGNRSLLTHLLEKGNGTFAGRYNVENLTPVIEGQVIKKEII